MNNYTLTDEDEEFLHAIEELDEEKKNIVIAYFINHRMKERNKNTDDILIDVLFQACGELTIDEKERIDNQCISAYENACKYLYKEGYLIKENDRIYRIIPNSRGR